jgi:hypothetical protein
MYGAGGGGTTRRSLKISSPGTTVSGGLERTGHPGMTSLTLAMWLKTSWTYNYPTIFITNAAECDVSLDTTAAKRMTIKGNTGGYIYTANDSIPEDTWFHLTAVFSVNFNATYDTGIYINGTFLNGSTAGTFTTITGGTRHVLLGGHSTSWPDFDGLAFDIVGREGAYTPAQMNYNGGNWQDMSWTPGANDYRLDGQNASDPGEDSSGNGNDFTQITGGSSTVTDGSDLPPGA